MVHWKNWNPGLDNDELTLGQVLDTLPGASPEDIGFMVRLLENPDSPFALPGAVTLHRHDCIHIVLGRGLLNQDEAFVIGFTMGTSKDISRFQQFLFKRVSAKFYPKPYRFGRQHLAVYDAALDAGKHGNVKPLYQFPFEEYHDTQLGKLRARLGIERDVLKALYVSEQALVPESEASKRLPV